MKCLIAGDKIIRSAIRKKPQGLRGEKSNEYRKKSRYSITRHKMPDIP